MTDGVTEGVPDPVGLTVGVPLTEGVGVVLLVAVSVAFVEALVLTAADAVGAAEPVAASVKDAGVCVPSTEIDGLPESLRLKGLAVGDTVTVAFAVNVAFAVTVLVADPDTVPIEAERYAE